MSKWPAEEQQRVIQELWKVEADLRAEQILQEEVHAEWRRAESRLENTLDVRYGDKEAALCFIRKKLDDYTHSKPGREQLLAKLRQLLESLAGVRPVGFVS